MLLPLATQLVQAAGDYAGNLPSMIQLLGLQLDAKLLPAILQPLGMTAVLFTGPLVYRLLHWVEQERRQQEWFSPGRPSIHSIRDCVVAPVTEEWCFRACMVPLLWMEVCTVQLGDPNRPD